MSIAEVARRCAAMVDQIAVSPPSLADRAIGWHIDRRRRNAAADPTWASIEARRRNESGMVTFLSDDLTVADHMTQSRIAREITPDPWWIGAARTISAITASRVVGEIVTATQRVRRGWADSDTWSLDDHLSRITAEMLDHLAANANGWPIHSYDTVDEWQTALRAAAADLRGEVDGVGDGDLVDEWWALAKNPAADPDEVAAARERHDVLEQARRDAQTKAWRWVADNHSDLWD